MPVTHSPGNPFAFSPAKPRGPSFADGDVFQHYKSSPIGSHGQSPAAHKKVSDDAERSEYVLKQYKEMVAHDQLLKDARIDELERKLLDEGKKMERTESDKRFLFDLQAKQALEISGLREEMANTKKTSDASIRDLRTANTKLRDQVIAVEDASRSQAQAQSREVDNLQSSLDNQRRAMDTLKADLTSKNNMLTEKNQRILDLETRCDEQVMANAAGSAEDLAFVTKELAEALSRVTSLEIAGATQLAKIHQLQESSASMAVLHEQKLALEKKVSIMDNLRTELAEAQVRLVTLERDRAAWSDLLEDSDGQDIGMILERQKKEAESAVRQMKLLEEQLNDSNVIVGTLRSELRAAEAKAEELSAQVANEKRSSLRQERSKAMAVREVNFLREQLRSYDLEEETESPSFDPLRVARIAELERVIDECRMQMASTASEEKEVEEDKVKLGTKRVRDEGNDFNEIERGEYLRKIRSLNAELEITKNEDILIRKELETLRAAHKVLSAAASTNNNASESPVDRPEDSSSTAHRILQYKNNPTTTFQAIRSQRLHDLERENAALLDQLTGRGEVSVPIQSLRNAESAAESLRAKITQREKMIARLKSVFAAKSSEFREAVYALLGYKLDFLPNGRVRLTSMYGGPTSASSTRTPAKRRDSAETEEEEGGGGGGGKEQGEDAFAFIFDGEAGTMQFCRPDDGGEERRVGSNRRDRGDDGEDEDEEEEDDDDVPASVRNLIKYWSGEKNSIPGMLSALTLELLDKQST